MKNLKFISRYSKGYRRNVLIMFVASLAYVSVVLLYPIILQFTIDNVINDLPLTPFFVWFSNSLGGMENIRQNLWLLAIVIIVINGLSSIALFVRGESIGLFAESFSKNLRNNLYDHLQKLPYAYHVRAKTGDLIQRCTSDVDQISRFLSNQLRELVYAGLMVIIALTILFGINVKMTFLAMIAFPIIFVFAMRFFKNMQRTFKEYDETEAEMFTVFQESLDAVRVVKAFNREQFELKKFTKKNAQLTEVSERMFKLLGMYWGVSDLICFLQILLIVIVSIFEVRAGAITMGDAVIFITYVSTVLWPIRNVGRILSDMGKVGVSIERLEEIFDTPMEDLDTGLTPEIKGGLVFEDVSFIYDDGVDKVLDGISFTVNPGETVAIMGPTGGGKSSLVHLLTRLYDPSSGRILVDGTDITTIARHHLRSQVGLVLQEPFLFSKSIFENIKLATPNSSELDVHSAASIASIHDVIKSFDQGYETLVGEKGVTLSGGQKQRVAIARTVINRHPLVIFDDSLSALDSETDASIRKELKEMSSDATTLIITHRVNSAMNADRIVVVNDGKVDQIGTHFELMAQEGLYRRIALIQNNQMEVNSHES